HDTAVNHGVGAAVSPIVAGADRVEGHPIAAGDIDNGNDLIGRTGPQSGRDRTLDTGRAGAVKRLRVGGGDDCLISEAVTPRRNRRGKFHAISPAKRPAVCGRCRKFLHSVPAAAYRKPSPRPKKRRGPKPPSDRTFAEPRSGVGSC